MTAQGAVVWARRRGPASELEARRKVRALIRAEHLALAASLLAGLVLLELRGWGLGTARWLALKVGLTAFLLLPLEAMHAWICHGWIEPGLRQTGAPPFSKDLARGVGMEDMLRALAVPLLSLALPLMVWLSLRRPG